MSNSSKLFLTILLLLILLSLDQPTTAGVGSNDSVTNSSVLGWQQQMLHLTAPSVGCFMVAYPSTVWLLTPCSTNNGPVVPYNPETTVNPMTVASEFDVVGQLSSTSLIGGVDASIIASGISEEYTNFAQCTGCMTKQCSNPCNSYSIQDNSNFFSTSYAGKQTTGWEQFIVDSNGANAKILIQYWLINYGTCPSGVPAPGGTHWKSDGHNDCYANSANMTTTYDEPASELAYDGMSAYAGASGMDVVTFCDYKNNCYQETPPDTVLNLYQSWAYNEFNILGEDNSKEAMFNSGSSLSFRLDVSGSGGSQVTPSCAVGGHTGETNNLYVDSCSSGSAYYDFSESTTGPSVTVQSVDQNNNKITGFYTVLYDNKSDILGTGFTPVTFSLGTYEKYVIRPEDYGSCSFSYWQDTGNTTRYRSFLITQESQTITAVYNCGSTGSVTVNTVDQNNNPITGYYVGLYNSVGTLINHGFSPVTFTGLSVGTNYSVEPDDYGSCTFNHWQDTGSTVRDRSFTAASTQTFTAVYDCT